MLKTISAAAVALSLIAAPAFAQGAGSAYFAGEYDNTEAGRILIHLLPSR